MSGTKSPLCVPVTVHLAPLVERSRIPMQWPNPSHMLKAQARCSLLQATHKPYSFRVQGWTPRVVASAWSCGWLVSLFHRAISARQSTCVRGARETFAGGVGLGFSNECSQPVSPDLRSLGRLDWTLMHRTDCSPIRHHESFWHTGQGFCLVTRDQGFIVVLEAELGFAEVKQVGRGQHPHLAAVTLANKDSLFVQLDFVVNALDTEPQATKDFTLCHTRTC